MANTVTNGDYSQSFAFYTNQLKTNRHCLSTVKPVSQITLFSAALTGVCTF